MDKSGLNVFNSFSLSYIHTYTSSILQLNTDIQYRGLPFLSVYIVQIVFTDIEVWLIFYVPYQSFIMYKCDLLYITLHL